MTKRTKTIDGIVQNKGCGEQWTWKAVAAAYDAGVAAERERCSRWAFLNDREGFVLSKILSGEPAPE